MFDILKKTKMNEFWNQRFSTTEYAYGENPNTFIAEELRNLKPGKILFPAEGEGRNAVFAAKLGFDVTAFDPSSEGKKKAEMLAAREKVDINYRLMGYENMDFPKESFDCIVLVFAHMPGSMRNLVHHKLVAYLKPGGTLILEGFSKEQITKNTGGPKSLDFLFAEQELRMDFSEFEHLKVEEADVVLDEGPFHQGMASVIRVVGVK